MSLNGTLAMSSRSLELFSLGIQVAGNNIANASSPGFVRDELTTAPTAPYRSGGVLIGSGARAVGVRQVLDTYLEKRIYTANADYSAANIRNQGFLQLQSTLQELGDSDLSTSLNNFVATINTVSSQPDSAALRSALLQQGQQFATDVTKLRLRIDELRDASSDQMSALVNEANSLLATIANLNPQITSTEANGLGQNDAGGLRVERLNALNRLAEIIPIRVQESPSGSVDVFTGSDYLLLGGHTQQLETVLAPTGDGYAEVNVQTTRTHSSFAGAGGELGGLIQTRDQILSGFITQLDQFVGSVVGEFNRIHASGEGLVGFTDVTGTDYVNDASVPLNQAGLAFTPTHGSFELKVRNPQTGAVTSTNIPIDLDGQGSDTSLNDLRTALNAIDHVNATITSEGKLRITADPGFEVRFGNDTSGTLAALGINTFFTGSTSGDLGINSMILNDQRLLATGQGGGPADNRNALALASFIDHPVVQLGGVSVDQFYTQLIGSTAQAAAAEQSLSNGYQGFRDSLKTMREQRSGVSLDEEAIRVMNLQHNYQAAARIVSTIDDLLRTLINI